MDVYHGDDCDIAIIQGLPVAVIGYGPSARAHALNLKDSGVAVTVGVSSGIDSAAAVSDGFLPVPLVDSVVGAGVVVLMVPDEECGPIYKQIASSIEPGGMLVLEHGFSVHYSQLVPRGDLAVAVVSAKAPGGVFRVKFSEQVGVPGLVAFQTNKPAGLEKSLAYSYALAVGIARAGFIETTIKSEVESKLFGGQAVMHGGVVELVKMGFESMCEAGISPELAYFETLHGLKYVADSLHKGGIAALNESITNSSEYGEYLAGQEIVGDESRAAMRSAMKRIKFGEYAMKFIAEIGAGYPSMSARRVDNAEHDLEVTGEELRGLIRWEAVPEPEPEPESEPAA